MGFMDTVKNTAEKLMGQGKEAVGQHTNDPDMAADGQKDQVMGDLLEDSLATASCLSSCRR